MKNRKITIAVIAVLVISVLGLGIAFAAFSRNLTINGNGTIQSSQFKIIFEGVSVPGTLGEPTLVGTAAVTTAPTIKNNATEISSFVASLRSPGDSITYNFKIHNTGDYAATVSSVVMASGVNLTTDTTAQSSAANTLNAMDYKLYYTDNNALVGSGNAKDCLEPGESENVSLRIVFSSTDATNPNILPSEALLLDNLGVTVNYSQSTNGSCAAETPVGNSFTNTDGAYYTYEGKSFMGTGVNNVLISSTALGQAYYAQVSGVGFDDQNNKIRTYETPAAYAAAAYCTNCRLMTLAEATSWDNVAGTGASSKRVTTNSSNEVAWWWLDNAENGNSSAYVDENSNPFGTSDSAADWKAYFVDYDGSIKTAQIGYNNDVRPVVSIPNGATMSGSGTQASPYVIYLND